MLNYEALIPAVERAAGIAMSNFPAHHDADDVRQELWVWIMQNRQSVERIARESEDPKEVITHFLVKVAQTYLKEEEAAIYGYPQEEQFCYSLDLIKSILEVVFRHEDWQSFATALDGMPRGHGDPATSGNNIASYIDVSRAVAELPEDQYSLLVWRYKYDETFTRIGEHLGISRQATQQRHEVAVKAIQGLLGERSLAELRNPPAPPVRPSKASVRARIEQDYEG